MYPQWWGKWGSLEEKSFNYMSRHKVYYVWGMMNEIAIQQFLYVVYAISPISVYSYSKYNSYSSPTILNNNESNFLNLRLNCSYMYGNCTFDDWLVFEQMVSWFDEQKDNWCFCIFDVEILVYFWIFSEFNKVELSFHCICPGRGTDKRFSQMFIKFALLIYFEHNKF